MAYLTFAIDGAAADGVVTEKKVRVAQLAVSVSGTPGTEARCRWYTSGHTTDGVQFTPVLGSGTTVGWFDIPLPQRGFEADGLYFDNTQNPVTQTVTWYAICEQL